MKLFVKRKVNYKEALKGVSILNRLKKVLTVVALTGILWSSIPWDYIKAATNDEQPVQIIQDNPNIEEQLPDYPTTTDPDFDPSKVAIESEVLSKRTETTKTFRKIDGTYETAIYNDVIHYLDEGEYKQVDNSLVDLGEEFETKENIFKVKFPKKLDDNKQIKLTLDKYNIDWNVLNIESVDIYFDNSEIKSNNIKELVSLNQSVLYKNIQNNVDIEYIVTGSKVKENIILNEYIPNFSMTFEYKLKDLNIIQDEDGNIVFVNKDNEVIFTFKDLFMLDNNLNESFDVELGLKETGNKTYEITVTPNDEWLQSASYPVKVDPSLVLKSNNTQLRDKYVYSSTGYNSTASYTKVGNNGIYNYRSYLEIFLNSIPNDSKISYAHLSLNTYTGNNKCTNDCQVNIKEIYDTISFDDIKGENLSSTYINPRIVDYALVNSSDGENVYYFWDISRILKSWQYDGKNIGVLELRNADESVIDYVWFDSLEYSTVTGPRVTIGYIDTSGVKDYWTYNNQNVGLAGTGYVSDYSGKLTFIRDVFNFTTEKQTLGLSMVYNINNRTSNIGYGLGWSTNYNIKMMYDSDVDTYHSVDATGNKVYYYSSSCDSRIISPHATNSCYIAEDGSSNVYVRRYYDGTLNKTFILTDDQIEYNFGTDGYLDTIIDTKKNLTTTITRNSTYKDQITLVTDDSGNKIDFVYLFGNLNYTTLSIKQNDGTYHALERVWYYYMYHSSLGNYALYYTESYKNYNDTPVLTFDKTAFYITDSDARFTESYISGEDKVVYTYNTSNDTIKKIESSSNGFVFGEIDYTYNFQETRITDHKGNYIVYKFDNYGHTVNVLDSFGNAQFYSYLNLFKCNFEDKTNGGLADITFTNVTPNYNRNHSLVTKSEPQNSKFNPVNNHGFEYDNTYQEVQWNFEIDAVSGASYEEHDFVTNEVVIGEYSAKIQTTNGTEAHYEQTLTLDEGFYNVYGYVMNKTNSSSSVYITVDGEFWQDSITYVPNDGEWHYIKLPFEVSSSNQNINIELHNKGEGYAYFDNIQVLEGFMDTRKNIIENPSFERVDVNGNLPGWFYIDGVDIERVEHSSSVSTIEKSILGDYSIKINGDPSVTRYAFTGITDFIDYNKVNGSLIIGGWAKSEGTPTSQMYSEGLTIDEIDRMFRIRVDVTSSLYPIGTPEYEASILSRHYIDFDPSIEGWQYVLEEISLDYDTFFVGVFLEYQGAGSVYFDGLQIYYENMNTDYRYDDNGRIISIKTPSGETTELTYDNPNDSRPTKIITDSGDIELTIPDEKSLVEEVIFNNIKLTPTYNSDGQVTQLTVGDTSSNYFTTSTTYLATGFNQYVSTTTDAFNKTTNYYHDTLTGLLEAIENSKGEDLHYVYDNEGKLIKAISLTDYNNPTDWNNRIRV